MFSTTLNIDADRKEISSLFDCTIRKQIDLSVAITLLNRQKARYLERQNELYGEASNYYKQILHNTPYFIDKDFIIKYRTYRRLTNADINQAPILFPGTEVLEAIKDNFLGTVEDRQKLRNWGISSDLIELNRREAWFTENFIKFDRNTGTFYESDINFDNTTGIFFDSEWYDFYIDDLNVFDERPHWGEIETLFTEMEASLTARDKVKHFIETELTPTIEQLEQMIPTPANPPIATVDSTDNYKLSDWYKELSQENQTELDDILSDEKQPGFKPYIDKLFIKGYFKLDENYTPTLGKMTNANLKRLINKLTPQSINGKFVVWENFFDIDKPLKNCSDLENPKSFKEILKDLGIEE